MISESNNGSNKTAVLYRMAMPDHTCPYGLKSKDLLERRGFAVEDHHLTKRAETGPALRPTPPPDEGAPSSFG